MGWGAGIHACVLSVCTPPDAAAQDQVIVGLRCTSSRGIMGAVHYGNELVHRQSGRLRSLAIRAGA